MMMSWNRPQTYTKSDLLKVVTYLQKEVLELIKAAGNKLDEVRLLISPDEFLQPPAWLKSYSKNSTKLVIGPNPVFDYNPRLQVVTFHLFYCIPIACPKVKNL